jgi:hypothetical protein
MRANKMAKTTLKEYDLKKALKNTKLASKLR